MPKSRQTAHKSRKSCKLEEPLQMPRNDARIESNIESRREARYFPDSNFVQKLHQYAILNVLCKFLRVCCEGDNSFGALAFGDSFPLADLLELHV